MAQITVPASPAPAAVRLITMPPLESPPDPELDAPGALDRARRAPDLRGRVDRAAGLDAPADAVADDLADDAVDDDRGTPGCPDCGRSLAARIACIRARAAGAFGDVGATTAEYAVLVVGVTGLAGLMVTILAGDDVRQLLTGLIHRALSM